MEINAKILIADENPQTRHATKEALARKGYRNLEVFEKGRTSVF